MTEYKIVIVGGGLVGKSALTLQLVQVCIKDQYYLIEFQNNQFQFENLQNHYIDEYDPTVEDSRREVSIDDQTCLLNILDTAGQQHSNAQSMDAHWSTVFVCLFNYFNITSMYDEIASFREQILRVKDGAKDLVPLILIINKADLDHESQGSGNEGQLAKDSLSFHQSSAKSRINLEEIPYSLVRELRKELKLDQSSGKAQKKKKQCLII
uniref:Ras-like protein n=1 Tax=Geodia cydonium TaxID=6047 RepID=RAS_GEOCY|nr:RecName: Full=Ras-like protein; Flags: Precursor [Geodia cydonium]